MHNTSSSTLLTAFKALHCLCLGGRGAGLDHMVCIENGGRKRQLCGAKSKEEGFGNASCTPQAHRRLSVMGLRVINTTLIFLNFG